MKTLYESLLDDDLITKTDKMIKDEIKLFLKETYNGVVKISKKPNADGKYEVSSTGNVSVKNRDIISLTNGTFIWTVVGGDFYCNNCNSLTSLEGAPKKVGGTFCCDMCISLISLEGAPKEVGGRFYCNNCAGKFTIEDVKKVSNVKGEIKC